MFKPNIGAADVLDRQSQKRGDEAYLEGLMNAPEARFLVLAGGKPVIAPSDEGIASENRQGGVIRWFSRDEVQSLGLPVADAYFLGVQRSDGGARFAISVSEHRARNSPTAAQVMRPIVDLRSLAMQGALPSEDLSLVGMAKSLNHWHETSRCCGQCGGTTMIKDGGWRRQCWACGHQHY